MIESVFGKFKEFIKKTPFHGIGKLVLLIPAFIGEITIDNVKESFESIHQQDVDAWIKESVGSSILSSIRQAFPKKME